MSKKPILLSLIVISLCVAALAAVFIFLFSISHHGTKFSLGGSVSVVEITGAIFESEEILKNLDDISQDDRVKAVVLRIDSPGGAVAPSQEIFEEVRKLSQKKVVVVSMGSVAASGGYYIACASNKIFANPGTITGSIGVIMDGWGFQEVAKQFKIENRVLKTGDYKDIGNPFREMTQFDKDYLQQLLNNMYGQFKTAVSESRKIPPATIDELAQGKVYTGDQALKIGLVDKIGTLYDAIDEAKKMASLSSDASINWPEDKETPLSSMFGGITKVFLNKLGAGVESQTGFNGLRPMFLWH